MSLDPRATEVEPGSISYSYKSDSGVLGAGDDVIVVHVAPPRSNTSNDPVAVTPAPIRITHPLTPAQQSSMITKRTPVKGYSEQVELTPDSIWKSNSVGTNFSGTNWLSKLMPATKLLSGSYIIDENTQWALSGGYFVRPPNAVYTFWCTDSRPSWYEALPIYTDPITDFVTCDRDPDGINEARGRMYWYSVYEDGTTDTIKYIDTQFGSLVPGTVYNTVTAQSVLPYVLMTDRNHDTIVTLGLLPGSYYQGVTYTHTEFYVRFNIRAIAFRFIYTGGPIVTGFTSGDARGAGDLQYLQSGVWYDTFQLPDGASFADWSRNYFYDSVEIRFFSFPEWGNGTFITLQSVEVLYGGPFDPPDKILVPIVYPDPEE